MHIYINIHAQYIINTHAHTDDRFSTLSYCTHLFLCGMEFWEIFSGDLHTLRTNGVDTIKGSALVKFRPTKLEASEVPQNQEKDDTKGIST